MPPWVTMFHNIYNVGNTLAYATPTSAATATTAAHTMDKILLPNKFDGTRSKLQAFTTQLWLKVISFPNKESRLCLTINCLTEEAMDQVQQYIKAVCINLKNVEVLIDILEEAFGNPNRVAEAEAKLCSL